MTARENLRALAADAQNMGLYDLTANGGCGMSTPQSPLLVVQEWEDEPDEGRTADEWPYPTQYTKSVAQGELAERLRRALSVADDLPVYVEERIESGGWSEYTAEDEYYMTITVGDARKEIDAGWSGGLPALLKWLDKAAPVGAAPARYPSNEETAE